MKPFLSCSSEALMRNLVGFLSTICTVSSRSSRSHSMERSALRSSVAAHSCSSYDLKREFSRGGIDQAIFARSH